MKLPPSIGRNLKQLGDRLGERVQSSVSNLSQRTSNYLSKKASEGSHVVRNTATDFKREAQHYVKRKVSDGSAAMTNIVSHTAQTATKAASEAAQGTSSYIKRTVSEKSDQMKKTAVQAVTDASTSVSSAVSKQVEGIKLTKDGAMRWFWWWSLAAIAVYGVATTVPRELIRQYADKSNEKPPQQEVEQGAIERSRPKWTFPWSKS